MELSFNTTTVDVAVALKALKLYRDKQYKEAILALLEVLDVEPLNFDARLMLGACYYKTGQFASAYRIFQMIGDRCHQPVLLEKADEGMRAAKMQIEKRPEMPAEFGSTAARKAPVVAWLD